MGVYARGSKLWVSFRDETGKRRWEPTAFRVGQEAKAEAVLAKIEERVAAGAAFGGDTPGPVTLSDYARRWIKRRKATVATWRDDEIRLNKHVLRRLGRMEIAAVRPRHLDELFFDIRSKGELSPHTCRNVYGTLRALFRDAAIAGLIDATPCLLTARQLGDDVFADPVAQATCRYSRRQLEMLVFSDALSPEARLFNALGGLAGLRLGEIAGLRWQDLDMAVNPLGRITVARSYEKRYSKTKKLRMTPIHPTLAAMLAEWKLGGWPQMFGRPPRPDDPVLPRRPGSAEPGGFHTKKTGETIMERALEALGIPKPAKLTHALRSTFISVALEDGADPYMLEMVTHTTKRGRSAFDVYARIGWEKLCSEVAKLTVTKPAAEIVQLRAVQGAETTLPPVTICDSRAKRLGSSAGWLVEAPGVEGGPVEHRNASPRIVACTDARNQEVSCSAGEQRTSVSRGLTAFDCHTVTAPAEGVAADDVAAAIARAGDHWQETRDVPGLRRALLQLLQSLEALLELAPNRKDSTDD